MGKDGEIDTVSSQASGKQLSHNIVEDLNLAEQRVGVAELGKIIDTKSDGVTSDINEPLVDNFPACSLSVEIKGSDFSTSGSCVEEGRGSWSLVVICLGIYLLFVR
ncbi:hypothetical protein ACOSP7_010615 [Xanthoceras sorbifolium]